MHVSNERTEMHSFVDLIKNVSLPESLFHFYAVLMYACMCTVIISFFACKNIVLEIFRHL